MNDLDVIIIGGGMSSLSACVKLIEEGLANILLIEAKSKLGGRILTIPYRNIISHKLDLVDRYKYIKKKKNS